MTKDETGIEVKRCMVRHAKLTIFKDGSNKSVFNVPYGATMLVEEGEKVKAKLLYFSGILTLILF